MQATTTTDRPAATRRSWTRAVEDLRDGLRDRELWSHLAWQDIKQRYRRSLLGPLWITLSMGVTAIGLGLLYSQLFGAQIGTFLPYLTVGFIVWGFIIGCMTEGADTFIQNEGLIKHLPAPISVYALRTVYRLTIMFGHNLIVYGFVVIIFFDDLSQRYQIVEAQPGDDPLWQPGLSWAALLAVPAFALLVINGTWVALLFGIISTRFRDIPQVIAAVSSLLFFMTPIVWSADILHQKLGSEADWRWLVTDLNPIYHFVELLRAPMIGNQQAWTHWVVVGGITIAGWSLTMLAMRNYRSRVSYWV